MSGERGAGCGVTSSRGSVLSLAETSDDDWPIPMTTSPMEVVMSGIIEQLSEIEDVGEAGFPNSLSVVGMFELLSCEEGSKSRVIVEIDDCIDKCRVGKGGSIVGGVKRAISLGKGCICVEDS